MKNSARRTFLKQVGIASAGALVLPAWVQSAFGSKTTHQQFTLPDLPYAYDALEPFISSDSLSAHHQLVHGGYVKKLQSMDSFLTPSFSWKSTYENTSQIARASIAGHVNHCQFWTLLTPGGNHMSPIMQHLVSASFGSEQAMWEAIRQQSASLPGSGWVWLLYQNNALYLSVSNNEDSLLIADSTDAPMVLAGIDLWEHAYYRDTTGVGDYLDAIQSCVNWQEVENRMKNPVKTYTLNFRQA
jgi:Fe-Mn family superoxide dismutase